MGGAHFHLWYFPALIFGVLLFDYLYKKIEMKKIILLGVIFYIIGLLGLSYYGILSGLPKNIMDLYFKIFLRTRNGVFFAFPFIVMGAKLAMLEFQRYAKRDILIKITAFYLLLNMEAFYLLKLNISKNTDGFIVLPFLVFYIMIFLLKNHMENISEKTLKLLSYKDYSLGIYLIHGIYLIVFQIILKRIGLENQKTLYFILVLIASITSVWGLKKIEEKNNFKFLNGYI